MFLMILNEVPFHLFNVIHFFFTFLKVPDEVNHYEMVIMMLTNVQPLPKEGLFFFTSHYQ